MIKIILHSLFFIYGLWKFWSNGIHYPYLVWGDLMSQSFQKLYVIMFYILTLPPMLFAMVACSFAANLILGNTENTKIGKRVLFVGIGLIIQIVLPPINALLWGFCITWLFPNLLFLFRIKVF
jgi:hypothetical protein